MVCFEFPRCLVHTKFGSRWLILLLAGFLLQNAGCSQKERPEFASDLMPATGTIQLDGQPLDTATVSFLPVNTGAGVANAVGMTNDAGQYHLVTPLPGIPIDKSQGAHPGSYRVVISKLVMPDGSPLPPGMDTADAMAQGAKELVAPEYSSLDQTTLEAKVERLGTNKFDFDIKSQ